MVVTRESLPTTILVFGAPSSKGGSVQIPRGTCRCVHHGEPVDLTAMEFDLLAFLMSQPGRVFTRLELLEAVRGEAYSGFERSVDSHIKRLRQKIEQDPHNPTLIRTIFGIGYKLDREGGA